MSKKMEVCGAVMLVKKKDAKAADAFGIKIFPCRSDDLHTPDFSCAAQVVWKNDLEALLKGEGTPISESSTTRYVPAYLSPPLPPKEGAV